MNYGDKLVLNENKDIVEITGVFPAGQGIRIESAEKHYALSLFGQQVYLPESLVSKMFRIYEIPKPIIAHVEKSIISKIISKPTDKKEKSIKKGK